MRFVSGSGAGSVMSALQGHDGCGTCYVIFEKGVLCGSEDDRGLSFWCLACLVYVPCIRGPCTSRERCLFLSRPSPSLASAQILSASVSQLHPPTFSSSSFRHISASKRAHLYTCREVIRVIIPVRQKAIVKACSAALFQSFR